MNCCEVNTGMGNIVQQAADPQHTHSCSSYTHSTDTLLSNLFPISCSRESDPQEIIQTLENSLPLVPIMAQGCDYP